VVSLPNHFDARSSAIEAGKFQMLRVDFIIHRRKFGDDNIPEEQDILEQCAINF